MSRHLRTLCVTVSLAVLGCASEVAIAPPPAQVEVVPPAPYAGAVWVGGGWHWRHHRHVWQPGYYTTPRPGKVWIGGTWTRTRHGYRQVPGHWHRR